MQIAFAVLCLRCRSSGQWLQHFLQKERSCCAISSSTVFDDFGTSLPTDQVLIFRFDTALVWLEYPAHFESHAFGAFSAKLRKRRASRSSESLAAWAGLLYSPCLAALYCFRSMAAFMPRLMAFACFCFVQLFSGFGGNAGASGRNRPLAEDMRSVCTHFFIGFVIEYIEYAVIGPKYIAW